MDRITNSDWPGPVLAGVLLGIAFVRNNPFDWVVACVTGFIVAFAAGYNVAKKNRAKIDALREKETRIDGVTYGENGKAKKITVWKN